MTHSASQCVKFTFLLTSFHFLWNQVSSTITFWLRRFSPRMSTHVHHTAQLISPSSTWLHTPSQYILCILWVSSHLVVVFSFQEIYRILHVHNMYTECAKLACKVYIVHRMCKTWQRFLIQKSTQQTILHCIGVRTSQFIRVSDTKVSILFFSRLISEQNAPFK